MKLFDKFGGVAGEVLGSYLVCVDEQPCQECKTPTAYVEYCTEVRLCSTECENILYEKLEKAGMI